MHHPFSTIAIKFCRQNGAIDQLTIQQRALSFDCQNAFAGKKKLTFVFFDISFTISPLIPPSILPSFFYLFKPRPES
jgi:hypothetical protein